MATADNYPKDDLAGPTLPKDHPTKIWYHANCHCGQVKYKTLLPPLDTEEVMCCNCSLCTRDALLLLYPPRKDVVFLKGQDVLNGYLPAYNKPVSEHMFCTNCGSAVYNDPHLESPDFLCINVRMFKDVKVESLKLKHFDGKDMNPPYKP
ncbi:MAG: hypothetical protein LQ342_005313 [Letrouitia transgressa]|nr:MAG: hypothetical protein LQ342_005313 [Letrouitia transgressa]